jgi:hypothetical protein
LKVLRRLLNLVAVVSLLLCISSVVLRVRSYRHEDALFVYYDPLFGERDGQFRRVPLGQLAAAIVCYRVRPRGVADQVRPHRGDVFPTEQPPDQPPPGPYFIKATTADGKLVSYMVQYDDTAHTMPDMLDQGEKALATLVAAVKAYVPIHDDAYKPFGVTFDDDKILLTTPAQGQGD